MSRVPLSDDISLLGDAGESPDVSRRPQAGGAAPPLEELPVVAPAEVPEGASAGEIAGAVAEAAAGLVAGDETATGDAVAPGSPAGLAYLLAGNALPLLGVLIFHWQVFPIVLLFWAENVVAGIFTVLKYAPRPRYR